MVTTCIHSLSTYLGVSLAKHIILIKSVLICLLLLMVFTARACANQCSIINHCSSVLSLSSHSVITVSSAAWVCPVSPILRSDAMSNIWRSLVFCAVYPLWHGWPYTVQTIFGESAINQIKPNQISNLNCKSSVAWLIAQSYLVDLMHYNDAF